MNYKIILASQSPRRQELMKSLGYDFETINLNIDESYSEELQAEEITEFLAKKKSESFGEITENTLLITADTIVWLEGKALEKPTDKKEAFEMLKKLSGNMHTVYTSVGFTTKNSFTVFTDAAEVYFNEISDKEAEYYIQNYHTLDKAGGYGIQDWLGLAKIRKIKGSYFTIMGFPTHIVYEYLQSVKF